MQPHPWLSKYPVKSDSKYLILGTHPPMPYCGKLEYYYGNMSEFWRFLDKVYPGNNLYNNGCPNEKIIVKFMNKAKIAITDMVKETNGEPFSVDSDMKWTKLNSKLKTWIEKSSVETIYFTSFGGKNSALNLFIKWLKQNYKQRFKIPDAKIWRNNGLRISLNWREILLEVLFSPSPTARRSSSRIKEYTEWNLINKSYDLFRVDWYKKKLPELLVNEKYSTRIINF